MYISATDAEKQKQIRIAVERVFEGRSEPWRVEVAALERDPLTIQLKGPHEFARKHELFGVEHNPLLIAALLRGWLAQYDQQYPREEAP